MASYEENVVDVSPPTRIQHNMKLCEGLNEVHLNNGKSCKLQYKDAESQVVLTLGKKEFNHLKHQTVFVDDLWLKEYDREMDEFGGQLFEFPIKFPPSYPFVEDRMDSCNYMPTRCPAWCDRVLLSQTAKQLLSTPVYLKGQLLSQAGRLSCCDTWLVYASTATVTSTATADLGPAPPASDSSSDSGDSAIEEVEVDCGGMGRSPMTGVRRVFSESDRRPPLTEKFIVKRVHSASVVEVKVGVVKQSSCRDHWRSRSMSMSMGSRPGPVGSRVRLISNNETSLPRRLHSHHSSSDEDWFEEVTPQESKKKPSEPPPTVRPQRRIPSRCFHFRRRKDRRRLSKLDNRNECCSVS
ncbi:hypothetical protein AAG570_009982 [Ranatra chinensis]|uniref:inositol-polyphosphate 5-phosphatase n=1 Tax=Ranatra chinensis TaxID=642074 RepID=A0ABD0YQP0_9HEMI